MTVGRGEDDETLSNLTGEENVSRVEGRGRGGIGGEGIRVGSTSFGDGD